jgi:hypothetical protein
VQGKWKWGIGPWTDREFATGNLNLSLFQSHPGFPGRPLKNMANAFKNMAFIWQKRFENMAFLWHRFIHAKL